MGSKGGNMRVALLFVLAICAAALFSCSSEELFQDSSILNRGYHVECGDCHAGVSKDSGKPGPVDDRVCYNCHSSYFSSHHPVGIEPSDDIDISMARSTFLLVNGKIQCITCHDVHSGDRPGGNPKLLRGGPYADRRRPCFMCHYGERYAGLLIHNMRDENGVRRVINGKPVCLFCHSKVPDPYRDRTKDVRFKADIAFLCWRCHPPMPGELFPIHFLVTPKNETIAAIKKYEKENEVIFPMVPHGRITCSTCHNPHDTDIITNPPAMKGAQKPNRLRVPKGELCYACHPSK